MLPLTQQVSSLELSQRLQELGVPQKESNFYWRLGYSTSESFDKGISTGKQGHFRDYELVYLPYPRYTTSDVKWNERDLAKIDATEVAAFTAAELGELLVKTKGENPTTYFRSTVWMEGEWWATMDTDNKTPAIRAKTEADARALMLIYLLEQGLLTL